MNSVISVFGVKLRLEILVIVFIIILFIFGNSCWSCSSVRGAYARDGGMDQLKYSYLEGFIGNSCRSCSSVKGAYARDGGMDQLKYSYLEGFTGTGAGPAKYNENVYNIDTASWGVPNLAVRPGQPLSKGVKNILNRPEQPIPLPEGEMLVFATTPFKPECCPNTYSNGSGCACMTVQQYNYIGPERAGNNIPYSEY